MQFSEELEKILDMVENLHGVKQPVKFHREVDAFVHTLQVFNIAAERSEDPDIIMAALLHDIGKSRSLEGHADIGVGMLRDVACVNDTVRWLIENHLKVKHCYDDEMKNQKDVQALTHSEHFPKLEKLRAFDLEGTVPGLLHEWDREQMKRVLASLLKHPG